MRVLIVDDEKIERDGIRFLLQQQENDWLLQEAANGSEAAERLRQEPFDLLLTDIRMPFMNGLELAGLARQLQKDIQIVIFSGYSDFGYAKQAIRYGVSDYVLKPVDPEEFRQTMQRVTDSLAERQRLLKVERQLYRIEGSYYLRQYLVQGQPEDLQRAGEYVDVSLWQSCGTLLLAESDAPVFRAEQGWLGAAQLQHALQCPAFVLPLQETRAALLFGQRLPCSRRLLAQTAQQYLEKHSGQPVWMAVSGPVEQGKLTTTFRELSRLLGRRVAEPQQRLLCADEPAGAQAQDEKALLVLLTRMKESARREETAALWKDFYAARAALNTVEEAPLGAAVKYVLSELLAELSADAPPQESENAMAELYRAPTQSAAAGLLQNAVCRFESAHTAGQDGARTDVALVKKYIAQHYDEDLSVESLAEVVYLSPGYLSALFKKETGQNLNTYIRNYRLEEARRLLENTNMKIVQVCEKTGFTSASYFCKRFREYFGTSPHRLRSTEGNNEETADPTS